MNLTKTIRTSVVVGFASLVSSLASAALYTTNYGSVLANTSNCDDCFDPAAFTSGSVNFFGNNYSNFFVSSNGYITFGVGSGSYSTAPIDTQTVAPMIAGSYTDLDSRADALSNVWLNTSSPGEAVITWDQMGHFSGNYAVRSTFQIVLRTDQFMIPVGQGQIGLFFGSVTDGSATSAGFGDGLGTINPGEVALISIQPGTTLNQLPAANWFLLNGGTPTEVPLPAPLALFGIGLVGLALRKRK
jgi:PEP-CTERM motif